MDRSNSPACVHVMRLIVRGSSTRGLACAESVVVVLNNIAALRWADVCFFEPAELGVLDWQTCLSIVDSRLRSLDTPSSSWRDPSSLLGSSGDLRGRDRSS